MTSVVSKDKIVLLGVDIQDKEKTIKLLERKLDAARLELEGLDDAVAMRFRRRMEDRGLDHKKKEDELNYEIQQMMEKKTELVQQCQRLIEEVKDTERDGQATLRRTYREGEEIIESERKVFKQGYDERLQRFMAAKASEEKESTARGMEPEFKRLDHVHEHELEQIQLGFDLEDRRLRDQAKQRFEQQKEDEKLATREETKLLLRAIQEKCTRDLEDLAREVKKRHRSLRQELDKQLERHQRTLRDKAQRKRQEHHTELADLQETGQRNLLSLRNKHEALLESTIKEHDNKVQDLRRQAENDKRRIQGALSTSSQPPLSSSSTTSKQRALYRPQLTDEDDDDGNSNNKKSGGLPRTPDKKRSGSGVSPQSPQRHLRDDMQMLPLAYQEQLAEQRRALETARDKTLQSLIRSLESESLRLERETSEMLSKEQNLLSQLQVQETAQLQLRQRQWTEEIAELVCVREQVMQTLEHEQRREQKYAADIKTLRNECAVFEDGIAAQRGRLQDKHEQHQLSLREVQLRFTPEIRELQHELSQLQLQHREHEQHWQEHSQARDASHAQHLSALHEEVQQEVGVLETQLKVVREEVSTETVKRDRLMTLVQRYGGAVDHSNNGNSNNNADPHHHHYDHDRIYGDDDEDEEELLVARRKPPVATASTSGRSARSGAHSSSRSATSSAVDRGSAGGGGGGGGRSVTSQRTVSTASAATRSRTLRK